MDVRGDALRHFLRTAVRGAGNPAAIAFPKTTRSGSSFHSAVQPPAAHNRMGLIGDEERAIPLRQFLRLLPVPFVRQNDPDVGYHGTVDEHRTVETASVGRGAGTSAAVDPAGDDAASWNSRLERA